jgi:peptidoglycan/xylan/chitin deacetylase (PgdA/CDA1 family)
MTEPAICLTGDVHHMGMDTRDQAHLDGTEVEAAVEYAEIAADHGIPVTLFCTGKCIAEEPGRMAELAAMETVELAGHNYWGFTTPVHDAWRALGKVTGGRVGSWMGPRRFQAHEIRKTVAAFEDLGVRIASWRDHAYRHDGHTADLLASHGITHFSDAVEPGGSVREQSGLTVVPINTPPDHEHVYHAFRTPEFVAGDDFSGPFGTESREPDEWVEWVLDHVERRREAGDVATVLAHPACMELADGLAAFAELCERIAAMDAEAVSMSSV